MSSREEEITGPVCFSLPRTEKREKELVKGRRERQPSEEERRCEEERIDRNTKPIELRRCSFWWAPYRVIIFYYIA